MKLFKVVAIVVGVSWLGGCGVPQEQGIEKTASALTLYQTGAPCTNCSQGQSTGVTKAESTFKYSCDGWTYRMLFSLEQHPQGAGFDSNWYAWVGEGSSVAKTGTVLDGVSADVYLTCSGGLHPSTSGTNAGGIAYSNRLYADLTSPWLLIPCTLTTVWPASWGLPNPVVTVELIAYDYMPSSALGSPNGILNIGLTRPASWGGAPPGYGWCGTGWYGGVVTNTSKLPLPPPTPMPGTVSLPSCSDLTQAERVFVPCTMPMPVPGA